MSEATVLVPVPWQHGLHGCIHFLSPAQPLVFLSASPNCAPWERKPQAPAEQGKGNVQNLVPEHLEASSFQT